MSRVLQYFEVRVGRQVRAVCFDIEMADRVALNMACDELIEVEVRPIRNKADRKG